MGQDVASFSGPVSDTRLLPSSSVALPVSNTLPPSPIPVQAVPGYRVQGGVCRIQKAKKESDVGYSIYTPTPT